MFAHSSCVWASILQIFCPSVCRSGYKRAKELRYLWMLSYILKTKKACPTCVHNKITILIRYHWRFRRFPPSSAVAGGSVFMMPAAATAWSSETGGGSTGQITKTVALITRTRTTITCVTAVAAQPARRRPAIPTAVILARRPTAAGNVFLQAFHVQDDFGGTVVGWHATVAVVAAIVVVGYARRLKDDLVYLFGLGGKQLADHAILRWSFLGYYLKYNSRLGS